MADHVLLHHVGADGSQLGLPILPLGHTHVVAGKGIQVGVSIGKGGAAVALVVIVVVLDLVQIGVVVVVNLHLRVVDAGGHLGQVVPEGVDLGVIDILLHLSLQIGADVALKLREERLIPRVKLLLPLVHEGVLHKVAVIGGEGILHGIHDGHVENGILPCQLGGIVLGEGDAHLDGVLSGGVGGDHAHQALLKAGDEGTRAQAQLAGAGVVPVGGVGNDLAVHNALIINVGVVAHAQGLIRHRGTVTIHGAVLEADVFNVGGHVLVRHPQGGGEGELHALVLVGAQCHVGPHVGAHVVVAGRGGLGLGGLLGLGVPLGISGGIGLCIGDLRHRFGGGVGLRLGFGHPVGHRLGGGIGRPRIIGAPGGAGNRHQRKEAEGGYDPYLFHGYSPVEKSPAPRGRRAIPFYYTTIIKKIKSIF